MSMLRFLKIAMNITFRKTRTITFLKSSFYRTTIEKTVMSVTFVLKLADKQEITTSYFTEISK